MKVYVIIQDLGYEGIDIIGVFTNKKRADKKLAEHREVVGTYLGDHTNIDVYDSLTGKEV
jgi:hypothetical protein